MNAFAVHATTSKSIELFGYASSTTLAKKHTDPALHSITVNPAARESDIGTELTISLPDNTSIKLTVIKKRTLQNGDRQIEATFADNGNAIMTFGNQATFANINSPTHNYSIDVDEDKLPVLVDQQYLEPNINLENDMRYPPDFTPLSDAQFKSAKAELEALPAAASAKVEITLLAVYSSEFANGFGDPVTRINQAIGFANAAYDRSGINIDLKLAHAQQWAFDNNANVGSLLSMVRNDAEVASSNGDFVGIDAIRDQYYADLVTVLPYRAANSFGGIAYVNGNHPGYAFSVSQFARYENGTNSVFTHEIGHNLGSGHEHVSANPNQRSACDGGFTGYACGHGNGSQGTIMSYLNDAAWGYVFSNPQQDCLGEPCGIPNGQPNPADNKTSFNISAPLIRDFRIDTTNDDDKDNVKNDVDNCPNVANPSQTDTNSDGEGDACDNDDDGDGVNDGIDNCPLLENPEQLDSDNNGTGDVCESDLCLPLVLANRKVAMICL
ncbi:zinc-dependent metalloprotease family protein [Arenicella xantha]|nr:M12 family metallo-peptidase [Arenicella xantha]